MSGSPSGSLTAAVIALACSPYLARLTRSVPDRAARRWWLGFPAGQRRQLGTAAVAVVVGGLAGAAAGWGALLPALLCLALCTTPLIIIDVQLHRLPDRLVAAAAVGAVGLLALAAAIHHDWSAYARALEAGTAEFLALLLIVVAVPRSLGLGDAKLGAVLGAYLGWFGWPSVYYGLFAGFLLGMLVALALMAAGRADRKPAIPFGPMLILGALLVLAFGPSPQNG